MSPLDPQNLFKSLTVKEAMRRLVVHLPPEASLAQAIRHAVKYKVNAILVTSPRLAALGVVTKTDIMGAYYAGLPITTPLNELMVGPPQFCHQEYSLEVALEAMRTNRIHRLFVWKGIRGRAIGVLAYPDIVGLLYRYCHSCERSILRSGSRPDPTLADHFRVREVMTPEVFALGAEDNLLAVMKGLAAHKFGALLLRGKDGAPQGVVSKTDLMLAYMHGVPADSPARTVMSSPVNACNQEELLVTALRQMILSDVYRLFVYKDAPASMVGVLSLSDAARFRSGTCRACLSSRIQV